MPRRPIKASLYHIVYEYVKYTLQSVSRNILNVHNDTLKVNDFYTLPIIISYQTSTLNFTF